MRENFPQAAFTRSLKTLGRHDLLIAGGKGASLAAMLGAGFPVPDGFAVRGCWASLWNPRAVSYRKRVGLDTTEIGIAVVVQRMIDADRSGVLFTANPFDHRRDRMLLSASFGLGEAVVGGDVTPDTWVLDVRGKVIEYHLSDKQVLTVREGKGTVNRPMPEKKRRAVSLQADELVALAELGARAQSYFDSPQDLEWTIEGGRIYLVQSRPITSLFPLPEPLPTPEDGLRLYLCFNVNAQPEMLFPGHHHTVGKVSTALSITGLS